MRRSCINSASTWDYTPERIQKGNVKTAVFCTDYGTDTSYASVEYAFFTNSDSLFKDTVNYIISDFVQGMMISEPDSLVTDLTTNFFQHYTDSFAAIYRSMCADEFGVWSADMNINIDESLSEFVQLSFGQWGYMGGAHGSAYNATIPIDRATGVVLELEDFFTDFEAVSEIAEPYFRKSAGIEDGQKLTEAGFWFDHDEFHINNNFTFSDDSVSFFYNQYEIAPYAAGVFEVSVPLKEIETFLKRPIK